jgi:hypothetical protein
MESNCDAMKGMRIAGFTFPTPATFELKLIGFGIPTTESVTHSHLLFLNIRLVDFQIGTPLIDSIVMDVVQSGQGSTELRLNLTNGSIFVRCAEVRIRSF